MLPHVAESHVRVLINNSTVGIESELSVPPIKAKRLPHKGTGDGGSSTKGTPCLYPHGTQGVQWLSSLVCLGWERRIVQQKDISENLLECTKGPSPPGW